MNTRHRNGPWRGYRSNGGVEFASRGSPDRNRRAFNYEHTNYNDRGSYRRGGGRSRQQVPPTRTNVFVEAGRLAAEYLVSRGVLPPNAMQGNWRNGEAENKDVAAHSLSRSASLDAEVGRRCEHDKELVEVRTRSESLDIDRSDVNSESAKSRTWIEGTSIDDGIEGCAERYDKDGIGGLQNSSPGEATNREGGIVQESLLQKCNSVQDGSTNASSFNNEKSLPLDDSVIPVVESDDTTRPTEVSMEVKMERNENDLQELNNKNKITDYEREDANVITDPRSSLTIKNSNNVQDGMMEDGSVSEREKSEVSGVQAMDVSSDLSVTNPLSCENLSLRNFDSDVIGDSYMTKVVQSSGPFSGRSVREDQKPDAEGLIAFESLSSLLTNKSSKRTLDSDDDSRDSFKRIKEWFPIMDTQVDNHQQNQLTQQEKVTSQSDHATVSDDQKGTNVLLSPKGHTNSSELLEEKQILSGSFQSWDLNLLGTSDGHENHDVANPVLVFPSYTGPETGKEVVPIQVDLSMSTNRKPSNSMGKYGINDNGIEIIDLEDESAEENKRLDPVITNDPQGRGDTMFADLDGFRRNTANENPSVQGGRMMSELYGNGSQISAVSANFNSSHDGMSLSNGEGILGDDDSIYMSLGEIPSSQLGPWEDPNQDYRKPF